MISGPRDDVSRREFIARMAGMALAGTLASGMSGCDNSALRIGDRVARRFMQRHDHWPSYPIDLALEGLLRLYDATGERNYLDHVLKVWDFRGKTPRDWLNYKILFTCIHYETWLRTRDARFVEGFADVASEFRRVVVRAADGAAGFFLEPRGAIFVDMIQGYATFMARAGQLSGDDSFFDECAEQYRLHRDVLRDKTTGLWHHGRGWHADDPGKLSPPGWCRGQGWVLRGMVDSLAALPAGGRQRRVMLELLGEFAGDLLRYQDRQGMWHQLMQEPETYPETSGTALVIHYLWKAVANGWLPREPYLPAAKKGLRALLGFVDEAGVVANCCVGTAPQPSLADYRTRPHPAGEPHSIGPVLMACAAPAVRS
jgi:rhamnogalacturonyl hydrolase YesR